MVYDGVIVLVALALIMAGWTTGLINSWRGPIAIVIATVATQFTYIDFATWEVQQMMIQPAEATLLAYFMLWVLIEIMAELLMNLFLTWNRKDKPVMFDRAGGAAFGLVKWFLIFMLPMMAFAAPNKVPAPPSKEEIMVNPFKFDMKESSMLTFFSNAATGLKPLLGGIVLSDREPSFKPNFEGRKVKLE